jgi:hypothetical protein
MNSNSVALCAFSVSLCEIIVTLSCTEKAQRATEIYNLFEKSNLLMYYCLFAGKEKR